MMTNKEMWMWDVLVDYCIATEDEICLVRECMQGTWTEILEAVLYARTGQNDFDEFLCEVMGDEEDWVIEEDDIYQDW